MKLTAQMLVAHLPDAFMLVGASLVSYGVYLFDARLGFVCMGSFCLAAGVLIAKGER